MSAFYAAILSSSPSPHVPEHVATHFFAQMSYQEPPRYYPAQYGPPPPGAYAYGPPPPGAYGPPPPAGGRQGAYVFGAPAPMSMMPPTSSVSLVQVPGVLIVESTQLADILLSVRIPLLLIPQLRQCMRVPGLTLCCLRLSSSTSCFKLAM